MPGPGVQGISSPGLRLGKEKYTNKKLPHTKSFSINVRENVHDKFKLIEEDLVCVAS